MLKKNKEATTNLDVLFDSPKEEVKKNNSNVHSNIEADEINRDIVESEHVFNKNANLLDMCDSLITYMQKNGVDIDLTTARSLISAMSTTRLIFLNHNNIDLIHKFIEILCDFFKIGNYFENSNSLWKNSTDLLLAYKNGEYQKSNIFNAITTAKKDTENMIFSTLYNVYPTNMNYFNDFLSYVRNPIQSSGITVSGGKNGKTQTLDMPKNLWFFMVISNEFEEALPKSLSDVSITINLGIRECEANYDIFKNDKLLSVTRFLRKSNYAFENIYLSDEAWNKIDKLEDFIDLKCNFSISNKAACQIEEYTSCLLALGADEKQAIDLALASKILPMAYSAYDFSDEKEKNTKEYIDKLFTEGTCPYSFKFIDKIISR